MAYIEEMVKDHQTDDNEFEDARKTVKDPNLITFIERRRRC